MLVLDHSGSMAATDVAPTRISAAIRAANQFIAELPPDIRVGAVGFGTTPDAVQQPVPSHAAARNLIDAQVAGGGTDTGPALALALSLLHGGQRHHPPSAIVLLSDGAANLGESPVTVAQVARRDRIPIYTVALGTPSGVLDEGPLYPPVPVPPDPQLMAQIASASGGRTFDAQSTDQLSSIYQALGRQLSTVPRKREITAEVALVAALLAVIALLASMRTATRLA
jgi:Ca-activated chloride channel family protein